MSSSENKAESQHDREPKIMIEFDSAKAGKSEVDPAELVGKVIDNIYYIGPKDSAKFDDPLPGSYGISFTDRSKYHIRALPFETGGVDFEGGDGDALRGKRVTTASLLEYTSFAFQTSWDGPNWKGDQSHIAVGIKVDGEDHWYYFEGSNEDCDSDGLSGLTYHSVFLVKMNGPGGGRKRR